MSDSPDAIRADIERTRQEFGRDVDALADKVTPSKIVQRKTEKVKGAVRSVVDRVMGAADDAGSSLGDAGSSVASAGRRVTAKAEGNPLAVGVMAFAAGLVVAALIPASQKEKELAEDLKDKAQPLVDEATEVAKTIGQDLKEPAQDAVAAVKDEAAGAVETVKEEAVGAAHTVADDAQRARDDLGGRG
jgi:gas vesicle protein